MRKSAAHKPKVKRSQAEINRVKPVGVLTIETLKVKAQQVHTVNVELPDGEIYEFYHLPVTVDQSEEFFSTQGQDLSAVRKMLADVLCNKDGSEFCTEEDLGQIDYHVRDRLIKAIFSSAREEGGED